MHEAEVGFGTEVVVEADEVEEVLEVLEVDHPEMKTGDGLGGLQMRQGINEKITYIADEVVNEISNPFGAMQRDKILKFRAKKFNSDVFEN